MLQRFIFMPVKVSIGSTSHHIPILPAMFFGKMFATAAISTISHHHARKRNIILTISHFRFWPSYNTHRVQSAIHKDFSKTTPLLRIEFSVQETELTPISAAVYLILWGFDCRRYIMSLTLLKVWENIEDIHSKFLEAKEMYAAILPEPSQSHERASDSR